ncbi:hypothetical protein QR680_011956 [Steinernema hermaphroditum]|uniref:Ubiquitin-like-conjugating enzyme ATG10 n=1 Tax=Steinernema hermaphroditum TaxID=289476 RepID=A0AA39I1X8_9BILA|nr:hypothetical protein QR680_011956 [Steinernema hermaphroditum]
MPSMFGIEGIEPVECSDPEGPETLSSTPKSEPQSITKEEFLDNIKEISCVSCRSFDAGEHWVIETRNEMSHLINTSTVESTKSGAVLQRTISVTYSDTYRVPIFWFSYKTEGTEHMLYLDDLEKELHCAAFNWNSAVKEGMHTSLLEHPITGQFLYQCHPCETEQLMSFAKGSKNYVMSWLSYMCSQFGVHFDCDWGTVV